MKISTVKGICLNVLYAIYISSSLSYIHIFFLRCALFPLLVLFFLFLSQGGRGSDGYFTSQPRNA